MMGSTASLFLLESSASLLLIVRGRRQSSLERARRGFQIEWFHITCRWMTDCQKLVRIRVVREVSQAALLMEKEVVQRMVVVVVVVEEAIFSRQHGREEVTPGKKGKWKLGGTAIVAHGGVVRTA